MDAKTIAMYMHSCACGIAVHSKGTHMTRSQLLSICKELPKQSANEIVYVDHRAHPIMHLSAHIVGVGDLLREDE